MLEGAELAAHGGLIRDLQRMSGLNETWAWNCWNLIGTSDWLAAHDEQVSRNALLDWANYQEQAAREFGYALDDVDQKEVDGWVKAIRYYANYKYPEQTP